MSRCWLGKSDYYETLYGWLSPEHSAVYLAADVDSTCMLDDGHTGPHEWTRDDRMGVTFPEATEEKTDAD
jgi:hypothetical protein